MNDLGLTGEDLVNAIKAIEGTAYAGKDAATVSAMLGRFRAAVKAMHAPRLATTEEPAQAATKGA